MTLRTSETDPVAISLPAARVSIVASVATLACLGVLHLLSPEFDPSWRVVSEYALGHFGWVLALMFLAWAVSSWTLAFAIRSQVRTIGGKIGLAFLVVAGAGEALASVFDVRQPVPHGVAGALGVPSLPIAAMLISVSLCRTPAWRCTSWILLVTAGLTWASLTLMIVAMLSLQGPIAGVKVSIGWPNRLLIVAYCLWVVVVGWQAVRLRSHAASDASVRAAGQARHAINDR